MDKWIFIFKYMCIAYMLCCAVCVVHGTRTILNSIHKIMPSQNRSEKYKQRMSMCVVLPVLVGVGVSRGTYTNLPFFAREMSAEHILLPARGEIANYNSTVHNTSNILCCCCCWVMMINIFNERLGI